MIRARPSAGSRRRALKVASAGDLPSAPARDRSGCLISTTPCHDASHAIFAAIDHRMTSYVERTLGIDPARQAGCARHIYWRRLWCHLARHGPPPRRRPAPLPARVPRLRCRRAAAGRTRLARLSPACPGARCCSATRRGLCRHSTAGTALHRHITTALHHRTHALCTAPSGRSLPG